MKKYLKPTVAVLCLASEERIAACNFVPDNTVKLTQYEPEDVYVSFESPAFKTANCSGRLYKMSMMDS